MDMKWSDIVTAAAKGSVSKEGKDWKYIDLYGPELRALVQFILSLPQQDQELLLGVNAFHLPMGTIEEIYGIQDAEKSYAACRRLLSVCVGCREGELISERTLQEACGLAVHEYVRQEFEAMDCRYTVGRVGKEGITCTDRRSLVIVPRKKKVLRTAMMIAAAILLFRQFPKWNDSRIQNTSIHTLNV